jgi:hypothetical protein
MEERDETDVVAEAWQELPEIVRADAAACEAVETRRKFLRQHKRGWWRNAPNPFAVGNRIEDGDL